MKTKGYQPTGRKLLPHIQRILDDIRAAERNLEDCRKKLRRAQEDCPHKHKIDWTNNDGDGQFIVERCEDCGAQEDGGLK